MRKFGFALAAFALFGAIAAGAVGDSYHDMKPPGPASAQR